MSPVIVKVAIQTSTPSKSHRLNFDPGGFMYGGVGRPADIRAFRRTWLIPNRSATSLSLPIRIARTHKMSMRTFSNVASIVWRRIAPLNARVCRNDHGITDRIVIGPGSGFGTRGVGGVTGK